MAHHHNVVLICSDCSLCGWRFAFAQSKTAWGRRMLVTKALSQDVMVLSFVPLLLIPKESRSLLSNQLIYLTTFLQMLSSTSF